MFRFLFPPLRRAYRTWAEARAYARSTRITPIAEETPLKPSGCDRLHGSTIPQQATVVQ